MSVNNPEVVVLDDNANQAQIKVIGYFNALTSSNTKIQANSLFGANTAVGQNPILSITNALYSTSLQGANGRVSVDFVGSTNVKALQYGRYNDGEMQKYILNNAVAPSGDLSINVEQAGPNDSFTLILTVLKENGGIIGNAIHWGAGAWANAYVNT